MELADVPVSDDWPIAIELVPPALDPRPSEIALVAVVCAALPSAIDDSPLVFAFVPTAIDASWLLVSELLPIAIELTPSLSAPEPILMLFCLRA